MTKKLEQESLYMPYVAMTTTIDVVYTREVLIQKPYDVQVWDGIRGHHTQTLMRYDFVPTEKLAARATVVRCGDGLKFTLVKEGPVVPGEVREVMANNMDAAVKLCRGMLTDEVSSLPVRFKVNDKRPWMKAYNKYHDAELAAREVWESLVSMPVARLVISHQVDTATVEYLYKPRYNEPSQDPIVANRMVVSRDQTTGGLRFSFVMKGAETHVLVSDIYGVNLCCKAFFDGTVSTKVRISRDYCTIDGEPACEVRLSADVLAKEIWRRFMTAVQVALVVQ